MKTLSLTLAALVMTGTAWADGVQLKDGRYIGPVIVFTLTPEQKHVINQFCTCHLENFKTMNEYTPYVLRLTPGQSKELRTKVGFAPRVFEAFETYRGFNDAGPHWNLALRFSEDQIDVPHDLLLSVSKATQAHAEQGWKTSNPCFPELAENDAQPFRQAGLANSWLRQLPSSPLPPTLALKMNHLIKSISESEMTYIAGLDYGQDSEQHLESLRSVIFAQDGVLREGQTWFPYEVIELGANALITTQFTEFALSRRLIPAARCASAGVREDATTALVRQRLNHGCTCSIRLRAAQGRDATRAWRIYADRG